MNLVNDKIFSDAAEGLNVEVADPKKYVTEEVPDEKEEVETKKGDEGSTEPEETKTETDNQEETEETQEEIEGEEEAEGAEDKTDKRSAKERIRELDSKKNEVVQENVELKQIVKELTDGLDEELGLGTTPQIPTLEVKEGQEITKDDYKKDVVMTADAMVKLTLARERNTMRIREEINDVLNEFPQLDPKAGDKFNPDLGAAMTKATRVYLKANPTGDVKGYLKDLMKPFAKSVEKAALEKTEAEAKHASRTALRPTRTQSSEKKFEDMSLEEMERKLGKVYQ